MTSLGLATRRRWRASAYQPVLAHPILRRLLPAFAASAVGDGMSAVAIAWLAIRLAAPGDRAVWRDESARSIANLSLSADGRRMAFDRNAANDSGICVTDLPDVTGSADISAPCRLVVPQRNSLGNLGQAVISPDGSKLYVTAARYGSGGQPVTRLAEVSAADGHLLRIAYERVHGSVLRGERGPAALASVPLDLHNGRWRGHRRTARRDPLAIPPLTTIPAARKGPDAWMSIRR